MNPDLGSWTSQASHLIGDCFDEAQTFLGKDAEYLPYLTNFVCTQLFLDSHLTSESILLLLRLGKEWDADILNRALIEGSLKLAYILNGSEKEIERKVNEYWNILPLFHQIRHGENARKILENVDDKCAPEWRPFHDLLNDDAAVSAIRAQYSKTDRKIIEERWSFVGLCRSFANSKKVGIDKISALAHGYAMSSHLLHKDADGIGMVWDRSQRSDDRRNAVTLGHCARIVSDVCVFAKLRLFSVIKVCNGTKEILEIIDERYRQLDVQLGHALQHFHDVEYQSSEPQG